jgi:ribonucleotide monophosphatase NagD (HAD superfamily)
MEHFPDSPPSQKDFLIIGDNLFTDILFGKNSGMDTALVLTGTTHLDNPKHLENVLRIEPTYVVESLSDLL